MALELKGLKASMMKLQGRVDRLNSLAAAGDEKGAMLEGHLTDIGKQLGAHVDDIEFAANMLGNSGGRSEDSETGKERPKTVAAVQQAEVTITESTRSASPPEPGSRFTALGAPVVAPPTTFPGQV